MWSCHQGWSYIVKSAEANSRVERSEMTLAIARLFVVLMVSIVAASCSGTTPSLESTTTGPVTGNVVPAPASNSDQYQLGPGDKLRVIVFNESELSGEFVVDDNGAVNMPLIGAVEARGAAVNEFQNRLVAKLSDGYLKDPKVSVEVLNYRPFFITGEVKSGGEYPYKAGLTVQDAVGVAGGYSYRANTGIAYIRRAGQDREQQVALKQRIPINPGDSIRIPERFF
jgi:polysaccharide export outer membrane protein